MKISITPNSDQIRAYAKSAMHAWDFNDARAAREQVIADMVALLSYLDACDNGKDLVIAGIRKIERGVRLEIAWAQHEILDLKDRYVGVDSGTKDSGNGPNPTGVVVERVGLE